MDKTRNLGFARDGRAEGFNQKNRQVGVEVDHGGTEHGKEEILHGTRYQAGHESPGANLRRRVDGHGSGVELGSRVGDVVVTRKADLAAIRRGQLKLDRSRDDATGRIADRNLRHRWASVTVRKTRRRGFKVLENPGARLDEANRVQSRMDQEVGTRHTVVEPLEREHVPTDPKMVLAVFKDKHVPGEDTRARARRSRARVEK